MLGSMAAYFSRKQSRERRCRQLPVYLSLTSVFCGVDLLCVERELKMNDVGAADLEDAR